MKLTLNILKCGLYSQNPELVITCGRVLSKIGQEINLIGGQLSGLAWEWFTDNSNASGGGGNQVAQSLGDASDFLNSSVVGRDISPSSNA